LLLTRAQSPVCWGALCEEGDSLAGRALEEAVPGRATRRSKAETWTRQGHHIHSDHSVLLQVHLQPCSQAQDAHASHTRPGAEGPRTVTSERVNAGLVEAELLGPEHKSVAAGHISEDIPRACGQDCVGLCVGICACLTVSPCSSVQLQARHNMTRQITIRSLHLATSVTEK
jgi:hypothetical protein